MISGNHYEFLWDYQNDYGILWTKRVISKFESQDSIKTTGFFDNGFEYKDSGEINYALKKFYDLYEFDFDMKLTPTKEDENLGIKVRELNLVDREAFLNFFKKNH